MMNGDAGHDQAEEADSKQDGSADADSAEDANEQEVIVIQDTGFTVKIQAPGTEPFDLQVSPVLGLTPYNMTFLTKYCDKICGSYSGVTTRDGARDPPSSDGP